MLPGIGYRRKLIQSLPRRVSLLVANNIQVDIANMNHMNQNSFYSDQCVF